MDFTTSEYSSSSNASQTNNSATESNKSEESINITESSTGGLLAANTGNTELHLFARLNLDDLCDESDDDIVVNTSEEVAGPQRNGDNANDGNKGHKSTTAQDILNPVSLERRKSWYSVSSSSGVSGGVSPATISTLTSVSEKEDDEDCRSKHMFKKKHEKIYNREGKECCKVSKRYGGFLLGGFFTDPTVLSDADLEYMKAVVLAIDNLFGFCG